jgi:hypothetical protein
MEYFPGDQARQEYFAEDFEGMVGLPDLPRSNPLTLRQVSQKVLNIFSRSFLHTLVRQEAGKGLGPPHIEWRPVRVHPVFLRAGPESFP